MTILEKRERLLPQWPDGVTVSTLDFESSDGGSNPPRSYYVDTKIVIRNLIVIT